MRNMLSSFLFFFLFLFSASGAAQLDISQWEQVSSTDFVLEENGGFTNRRTRVITDRWILTNETDEPIVGPFLLEVVITPNNVTNVLNRDDVTLQGTSVLNFENVSLLPGESLSIELQFANPGRTRFTYVQNLYKPKAKIEEAPVFEGDTQLLGFVGEVFSHEVLVDSQSDYTLTLLQGPDDLILDSNTGVVTWTPTQEGVISFEIKAAINESTFSVQEYTIDVVDAKANHEGSDFWLAFGNNAVGSGTKLSLYISSAEEALGTVNIPTQSISIPFTVAAGQILKIEIPPELALSTADRSGQNKGIHVTTDKDVVLYALNQKPATTDGFLVYPTETLGTRYRLMTYDGGQVYYVATEDDTVVDFVFKEEVKLTRDGNLGNRTKYSEGDVLSITLQKGEVYSFEANAPSDNTITGSTVLSNKPIAVFSGHFCTFVPSSVFYCDHLVEQMPPTHYWGNTYYSVPFAERFNGDVIRVVADFDNTKVSINGEHLKTLDAGEWLEDTVEEPAIIESNHPILVAQLATGALADYVENQTFGDPFMLLLTPQEQFTQRYQFTTTDQGIDFNYVNITASLEAIESMTFDNSVIDRAIFSKIGVSDLYGAQLQVTEGAHVIRSEVPFGAAIYGFGETDSYGYQAGIRLPRFTERTEIKIEEQSVLASTKLEYCFDLQIADGELPVSFARVDVYTENAFDNVHHYYTDEQGRAVHCHVGLVSKVENIKVRAASIVSTIQLDWSEPNQEEKYSPKIISQPVTSAIVSEQFSYTVNAVDANSDDVLTFELESSPSGMLLIGNQLIWTPSDLDVGRHPVTIKVSDNDGVSTTQSFYITTVLGNQNPVISTRSDNFITYVGAVYQNYITTSDPDGDIVYCEVIKGRRGSGTNAPQVCPTILTARYLEEDIGVQTTTIRFYDRAGGETIVDFDITVRDNIAPQFVSGVPPLYAKVGTPYSYQFSAIDADGDDISYALRTFSPALRDQTIDADTGLFSFTPSDDRIGEYDLAALAVDEVSTTWERFKIIVSKEDEPLTANVSVSPQFPQPGDLVNISSSLSGAAGLIEYSLLINGELVETDSNGNASFTAPSEFGLYNISYEVTDSIGQSTLVNTFYAISDGGDTTAPIVRIDSIENGAIVSKLSDVLVSVEDDNLASWELSLVDVGSNTNPEYLASGTTVVSAEKVHSVDPSMRRNGLYQLQLVATDQSGLQASDIIDIQLDGQLKVGNFTYPVNEFTIPLAGLPISINRVYDSRNKSTLGDFGYGWDLDYNLVKIQKSRPLGASWRLNTYSFGPLGLLTNYCVESNGDILVNVTLPDDEVERFKVVASPQCNEIVPNLDVSLSFEAVGDTQSTLELNTQQTVRLANQQLTQLGSGDVFDSSEFILTTRAGYKYHLEGTNEVTLISDPNGNTLTFEPDAIVHSSGKSIQFERDDEGKIETITRPDGINHTFTYDISDDLIRANGANNTYETYTYNFSHGLLTINDRIGRTKLRNIYSDNGRLIAQEDNEGNRTEFNHDLEGRESVITDRNGNITFYYYDEQGNVTSMVDALGHIYTYTYDANDNQLTETDPLGNTTTRVFNATNDLLSITDPEGNTVAYTYNLRGQETTITDAKGNVYTNTYDSVGNLLSIEDPLGNIAGNNINAQGLVTLTRDMLGNDTIYTYDVEGNKLTSTDALGVTTSYTYDADNRVITQSMQRTDADGEVVTDLIEMTYNRNGQPTVTKDDFGTIESLNYDALGNQTGSYDGKVSKSYVYDVYNRIIEYGTGPIKRYYSYDPEGNKLTETDENGNVTSFEYDAVNRLIKTTHPDESFVTMEYDPAGRLVKETDERGNTTEYAYDKAGRRTSMRDPLGNEFKYEYDAQDNMIKEIDALGRETTYVYDALDRRTIINLPDGKQLKDTYDALGRRISQTDQASIKTSFEYDPLGRLTKVIDTFGQETQYKYDEAGNKTKQIDSKGNTTEWEYDQRGRISARVLPLGQRETFTYDLAGNITSHTNFNEQTLTYFYTRYRSLVSNIIGAGINEYYQYNAVGDRSVAQNYTGRHNYKYDSRNRLIEEKQPDGTLLEYTYDFAGNKTALTTTYKNRDVRTETYTYDALNRLTSVTDNDDQTTTFEYDAVGNQTHIRYANGLVSVSEFDNMNRVTSITTMDADENILSRYAYDLDETGRRTRLTEHSGRVSEYVYDDLYRLIQESITDAVNGDNISTYTYGKTGNRTQSVINGITTEYVYDANDRLISQGAFTYTYDAQGNMLTETDGVNTKTYEYDANQRMIGFSDGVQNISYQYNPDGIRTSKNIDGSLTKFIVDSNRDYAQVIAETLGREDIVKEYVFGYDLLSQNDIANSNTSPSFFHYDSIGTTRNLSNADGTLTDNYYYEAFGELIASDGETDNSYLYTGEQFDAQLDNYYLRARYYNQSVGRFTQQDTWMGRLNEPETLNKYLYTHSDPINNIDPSGNKTIAGLIRTLELADRVATFSQAAVQPFSLAGSTSGKPTVGQLGASRLLAFMPGASGIKFLRFTSKNKKAHGNSKNSRKRQHVYRILDQSTFTVYKFGISGGAINKNGTSRRAVAQLPIARKKLKTQKVSTKILYRNLSNRFIALEVEKALVCSFYRANNSTYPRGNIKPRPKC